LCADPTGQVIVAGKTDAVTKAMQQAQRFREDLIKRGVVVIPIVWSSDSVAPVKKRGFGGVEKPPALASPTAGVSSLSRSSYIGTRAHKRRNCEEILLDGPSVCSRCSRRDFFFAAGISF
jgi:hypothetical protein